MWARRAAESAEMARFAVSERPNCEIWASGAVSYLDLGESANDMEKCAISARLSIERVQWVIDDLRERKKAVVISLVRGLCTPPHATRGGK